MSGGLWFSDADEPLDEGTPKRDQPGNQQAQVVPGSTEHGVDRVTLSTGQVVALKQPILLQVADDWLDGIAPPQLAAWSRHLSPDRDARGMLVRCSAATECEVDLVSETHRLCNGLRPSICRYQAWDDGAMNA